MELKVLNIPELSRVVQPLRLNAAYLLWCILCLSSASTCDADLWPLALEMISRISRAIRKKCTHENRSYKCFHSCTASLDPTRQTEGRTDRKQCLMRCPMRALNI